jgi:hypothetical protein
MMGTVVDWVVCGGSSQLDGTGAEIDHGHRKPRRSGGRENAKKLELKLYAGGHLPLGPAVLAMTEAACCKSGARAHGK